MVQDNQIRRALGGGVLRLTIDRPERGNAISPPQRDSLTAHFEAASGDPEIRVIVLTGSGDRHFCTGGDLRHAGAAPPDPNGPARPVGDIARLIAAGMHRLMSAVLDCDKPVIAAVNGTAAGIGVHLALCCDLVVAADDASFIEVFARRGLVADGGGAYLLSRLIGPHKTKELMFFADPLPATEAAAIGLINRAVPRAQLDEVVTEWADRLASGPTVAYGLVKSLVNRSLDQDRGTAFREEALAIEVNSRSADFTEGLRAFIDRRPVSFTGR
ncbi:MAG TPA: enoyl-CoA hydratase-related protein [Streptosporangiaceae bacterium]|jgi:2-(1,2-epoxy-1,2-dihydrophenyl)acetyl-CoA isomerase|nr:enoyl-CoA hydratase-related protein [Streptosporangiaceae bacterium]